MNSYAEQLIVKYTKKAKPNAYERPYCLMCGRTLRHKSTGRPRKFCSDACKQEDYRRMKEWVKRAVDAALNGWPEPEITWRFMPWPDEKRPETLRNSPGRRV